MSATKQVAVITGSASGIGLAAAHALGVAGMRIILCGRSAERGAAAEERLGTAGIEASFVVCDVTAEDQIEQLMAAAVDRFGGIDVLVNNAGPNGEDFALGPVHELDSGVFDRAMKVSAYGPFWCCKHAVPSMLARGGGAIVNVGAITGVRAAKDMGGYAIGKSVLEALGRQVAADYGASGIRCNTLLVGTIRPDEGDVSTLPAGFDTSVIDGAIARTTMMGRIGRYREVAGAIRYLVSPEASFVTGASLAVDGGAMSKLMYPDYHEAFAEGHD